MNLKKQITFIGILVLATFVLPLQARNYQDDLGLSKPSFPINIKVRAQLDYIEIFGGEGSVIEILGGRKFNLASLKQKIVFMNFWALWCRPCLAEMAQLQGLYDKLKSNKNIEFMFISDDDPQKVEQFRKTKNLTLPFYTIKELPVSSIPTTFIFAPGGKVVFAYASAMAWDCQESVDFLKKLENPKNYS